MKVSSPELRSAPPKTAQFSLKELWRKWYVQIPLYVAIFLAGALIYRTGALSSLLHSAEDWLRTPQVDLPAPVDEAVRSVSDELRMYADNHLPTLFIDMDFEDYQTLLAKRAEAIDIGVLNTTDEDFVPAEIRLQDGDEMDAKVRLKGDWTDHLQGDKWSFRIKMQDGATLLSTVEYSIQSPETRNYLYEWAFHKNLVDEGVMAPRYEFVNVLLNGKLLGIYAFEEFFRPELIESQGRRQGVIIRLNEDLMWDNITTFWSNDVIQEGQFMVTNQWTAEISTFQDTKVEADPVLAAEADTARNQLKAFMDGEKTAAEVFDVPLMGRFFALSDLWSACHGVAWHNLRFYYNPVTGLLEPVAYDAEPFQWCSQTQTIVHEFLANQIFNDPDVRTAYVQELQRVTQPEYVAGLEQKWGAQEDQLTQALKVEFPDQAVEVDWGALEERRKALSLELQVAQPLQGNYQLANGLPQDTGQASLKLQLQNVTLFPVQVDAVAVNGHTVYQWEDGMDLPPVMDPDRPLDPPVTVSIPIPDRAVLAGESVQVTVQAHLAGLSTPTPVDLQGGVMPDGVVLGPTPDRPGLQQALWRYPFLSADPERPDQLVAVPGVWDVEGDLILPARASLTVPAGTVLRFDPGSVLFLDGALNLRGQPGAPVVLTAQEETWGGIVVLNAAEESTWQYAVVEKTAGISRGGWILTGGITFYRTTINLDNVAIGNNQTEDAINVIHGAFHFANSEFAHTLADALDSDFSTGEIDNCSFHDIGGDAVDTSGTTASVSNTHMQRITDKGVSAGEQSTLTVIDVDMDTVGIGVASKDLSSVVISGSRIRAARFSALAAYIKKPVFGPGKIEAPDVEILDSQDDAVAQVGSEILLHGEPVPTVDLDVDKLYAEGVLGN